MKPASTRPTALVTGASSGIGEEIARSLAAAGHDLVLAARRADRLQALAAALQAEHGVKVLAVTADLARPDGADRLVEQLEAQGVQLDVLVNNAGFGLFGKHVDTDLAGEQQMIDVNITALTRLTKRVLPGMVRRGRGRILNVASTAAFQPGPYMAVYYATKAYVLSYSEALAEELAGTGVTVTALCPGPTRSEFQDRAAMNDSALVKDRKLPTAREVAGYGVRAMLRGRRVAIHGRLNCLMAQSVRFTPRRMTTWLVALLSRPSTPQVPARG